MSVIINGMDMPTNKELWIRVQPDGKIVSQTGYVIEDASAKQVPPHGRLIDADALRQDLKDSIDECNNWADEVEPNTTMYARISQALGTFVECSLRVKAAPTIIEAEGEEK